VRWQGQRRASLEVRSLEETAVWEDGNGKDIVRRWTAMVTAAAGDTWEL
jgi:hypothetical protein